MSGRGARDRPLTYHGEHDMALTYLPRQIVKVGTTAYLATALSIGEDPATTPASWLSLGGGGGDSEHNGTGTDSTAVGTSAVAATHYSTALGDGAIADTGIYSTALGGSASCHGDSSTAVGAFSLVDATSTQSVAVGFEAYCSDNHGTAVGARAAANAVDATALGRQANADGVRSIAIGRSAYSPTDDAAVISCNDLELVRSDGGATPTTSVIVASPNGTRWRLSISNAGAVVVAHA